MPMRFDFGRQLHNMAGTSLKIPAKDEKGEDIFKNASLGEICKWALLEVSEIDPNSRDAMGRHPQLPITGEEKFERFSLATKLHKGGVIEIEEKERAVIRRLVGCGFNVEAVGIIWSILDSPIKDPEGDGEAEDSDEPDDAAEPEPEPEPR